MAVKGLIHYALEVPDPAKGEAFYRDFGLTTAEGGGNALRLEAGRGGGGLLLFEGPRKRLHHVAFAAPGEHFAAVGSGHEGTPASGARRLAGHFTAVIKYSIKSATCCWSICFSNSSRFISS